MPTMDEEAEQRTDCHSTDGLVAAAHPSLSGRLRTQIPAAQ